MAYETIPIAPLIASEEPEYLVKIWEFDDLSTQSRPIYHRARRLWGLEWPAINHTDVQKLRAFVREHRGAATPFQITLTDPVSRPYGAPVITIKSGGALGSRTLYVGHTWSDGTNETTVSEIIDTAALNDGQVLAVTVPDFPRGVTQAIIYIGTSSSALHAQTPAIIVSGGSWGELETGYDSGGAAPPTTNSLTETPLVLAINDEIESVKIYADAYQATFKVRENI